MSQRAAFTPPAVERDDSAKSAGDGTQPPDGKPPDKGTRLVTLSDWGQKLPVGVPDSEGRLNKSFTTRPFKTRDEKFLGKLKKPSMTMAQYVSMVVAHLCPQVGPYDFSDEKMKVEEKSARLQQMYMGDIYYMYCWLRHEAIGDKLSLRFTCPTCRQEQPFQGDLKSLEVKVVDELEALRWVYDLHHPIRVRGTEVKRFQMSSPKWSAAVNAFGQEGDAKAAIAKGSVVALNDSPDALILTDAEIDELSKLDLEDVCDGVDERYVGPNMSIEGTCQSKVCEAIGGTEFRLSINWDYDNFFSGSSK